MNQTEPEQPTEFNQRPIEPMWWQQLQWQLVGFTLIATITPVLMAIGLLFYMGNPPFIGLGLLIASLFIGGGIGWYTSKLVMTPLDQLSQTIQQMAEASSPKFQASSQLQSESTTLPPEWQTIQQQCAIMQDNHQKAITTLTQQQTHYQKSLALLTTLLSQRLPNPEQFETFFTVFVTQLSSQTSYQPINLYLFDDQAEQLVMVASSASAASQTADFMQDLVTQAIAAQEIKETILTTDIGAIMALPICFADKAIGGVTAHHTLPFLEPDRLLLQGAVDYLTGFIQHTYQLNQVEAELAELRAFQQRYIQQAWEQERIDQQIIERAQFSLGESTQLPEVVVNRVGQQILKKKETITITTPETDHYATKIWGMPIMLDETAIGTLQFYGLTADHNWSESELTLIKAVVDQVAQTAESLRLVEEVRERASRQALISQIGEKLRRAPDLDSLMEITVSEIARVLNPANTFIQFGSSTHQDAVDEVK